MGQSVKCTINLLRADTDSTTATFTHTALRTWVVTLYELMIDDINQKIIEGMLPWEKNGCPIGLTLRQLKP